MKNRFDWQKIRDLCDGIRTMSEIAGHLGISRSLVDKVLHLEPWLPRRSRGTRDKDKNGNWRGGIEITKNGYALAHAPEGHPFSSRGRILLHRLIVERKIGRFLLPHEEVHHEDGCTLNNRIENLLIISRADHGKIHGGKPIYPFGHPNCEHNASFRQRYKSGDIREQKILHAHGVLSADEFDLLRTERYISPKQLRHLLLKKERGSPR